MNTEIPLKVFTDLRPLLESIGSKSQITEKALRQMISFLKQTLEDKSVMHYAWIEGKDIAADVLTMEGLRREALDEIMKKNFFRHARSKDNIVRFENNNTEFEM